MWRRKKWVIVAVLAAVVLAGSIGGIALANNGDDSQPEAKFEEFIDKVCASYNANTDPDIDCEALKAAFADARSQMCPEGMPNRGEMDPEALQNHLQNLFNEGKITEEQYVNMKDRIESMPDHLPGFGFRGHGGFCGFGRLCAPAE